MSDGFKRVPDTEIGIDDFYDVWDKVKTLSPCWQSFCLSLRLSPDVIESIESNNRNETNETCLRKALSCWLKKEYNYKCFGNPSWRKVCISVSNGGQNKALAEEIAKEHLVQTSSLVEQTPSSLSVTSDKDTLLDNLTTGNQITSRIVTSNELASSLLSVTKEQGSLASYEQTPPLPLSDKETESLLSTLSKVKNSLASSLSFGHGHMNPQLITTNRNNDTTLQQVIADSGIVSEPVYVPTLLSSNEGLVLQFSSKIQDLRLLFLHNLYLTKHSLESSSHTVSDITEYIQMHINGLLSPKLYIPSITHFLRQEFSSIATISELFAALQKYVSWFNYEFVVKLVKVFLPHDQSLKREWSLYHEKLKDYFINNIGVAVKCADGIEFGVSDVPGTKILLAAVIRDDYTANDLFFFHQAIPQSLKLPHARFYFYSVTSHHHHSRPSPESPTILKWQIFPVSGESGCLQLKCCIPEYVYSNLFPLTNEQLLSLAKIGITKLSCDSFEYEM